MSIREKRIKALMNLRGYSRADAEKRADELANGGKKKPARAKKNPTNSGPLSIIKHGIKNGVSAYHISQMLKNAGYRVYDFGNYFSIGKKYAVYQTNDGAKWHLLRADELANDGEKKPARAKKNPARAKTPLQEKKNPVKLKSYPRKASDRAKYYFLTVNGVFNGKMQTGYFTGAGFASTKSEALKYVSLEAAKSAAQVLSDKIGKTVAINV